MKKTNKYRKKTSNDQDQNLGSEGEGGGGRRERGSPPLILERECLPLVKERGREMREREGNGVF